MSDVGMRYARRTDLEQVLVLNQLNVPHVGDLSPADLNRLYERSGYFRVAFADERIAGFLIAFDPLADYNSPNFLWFKARYDRFIYIDRIAVDAALQRKGIARRLYADLETRSRERGIPVMACEYNLRPRNEISALFHRAYGFSEVGSQETEKGRKTVSLQVKVLS